MDVTNNCNVSDDAQLPFLQLSALLESMHINVYDTNGAEANHQFASIPDNETLTRTRRTPLHPSHAHALSPAQASVLAQYESDVLPLVKALFPRSIVGAGRPKSVQELSNIHIKLLVYAATNRLAGVNEHFTLNMMYDYLKRPFAGLIDATTLASFHPDMIPSILPMAETFFTCAIEVGDVQIVRSMLLSSIPGVHVNDTVCVVGGHKFTPIERSATLQHLAVTKLLLQTGADVNKTNSEISEFYWNTQVMSISSSERSQERHNWPFHRTVGALECALATHTKGSALCYELVTILATAGGKAGTDALSWVLSCDDSLLIDTLICQAKRTVYPSWVENNFLHECAERLNRKSLEAIIVDLYANGIDLSQPLYRGDRTHLGDRGRSWKEFWVEKRSPPHWIDIAALRGDLELVVRLRNCGAQMTTHVLVAAVRSRNVALVKYLLREQAPRNVFSTHFLSTPLAEALRVQLPEVIQFLESEISVCDVQDERHGCSMLAAAAEAGDSAMLRCLILQGCHLSKQSLGYALTKAILAHQRKAAFVLLDAGASLDSSHIQSVFKPRSWIQPYGLETFKKISPLVGAISTLDTVLIRRILDRGASLDGSVEAAVACGDLAILEDVMSAGTPLRFNDRPEYFDDGGSPARGFFKALETGDTVRGRRLIEAGMILHPEFLLTAVKQDDVAFVRMLLESGVDCLVPKLLGAAVRKRTEIFQLILQATITRLPNGLGRFGAEALDVAIQLERKDLVKVLIDEGAYCSPYREDDMVRSALGTAIRKESGQELQLVRALLYSAGSPDEVIWEEQRSTKLLLDVRFCETALLVAIRTEQHSTIQMILQHGSDINLPATGRIKRTPLQQAAESGSYSIVELLLEQGADVNGVPAARAGATALQLAAFGGNIGIVELLLDHGADPMAPGAVVNGWTAIEGAAESGCLDAVVCLLRRCSPSLEQIGKAKGCAQKTNHQGIVKFLQRAETEAIQQAYASTPQLILGNNLSEEHSLHPRPSTGQAGMKKNEDGRPTCAICRERVSSTSALRRHERTKHPNVFTAAEWKCVECSKCFSRKDTFNRHLATHNKIGYAQCPSCGHNCRPDYLVQHMTTCQS